MFAFIFRRQKALPVRPLVTLDLSEADALAGKELLRGHFADEE